MFNSATQSKFGRLAKAAFVVVLAAAPAAAQHAGHEADAKEAAFPGIVRPLHEFGTRGVRPGEFNEPSDVAIGKSGRVYIADCYNNRIQIVTLQGKPVRMWGTFGKRAGEFDCPRGLALDDNERVFVADLSHRIQVFDSSGTFLRQWGALGDGAGELNEPWGLTVRRGSVIVADAGNNRLVQFTDAGKFVSACGAYGNDPGLFVVPKSVAVDDNGNVYVADTFNNRIQKLSPACKPLATWGHYGSYAATFAEPSHVAYRAGRLFITDQVNHRIQVLDTAGKFVMLWARHPDTPHAAGGRVHYPATVAVDPAGSSAVVCEPFENRCQVFKYADLRNVPAANTSAWWNKYPLFHYGSGAEAVMAAQLTIRAPNDFLLVTEPDINRLVVFNLNANGVPTLRYSVGGTGKENGLFRMPAGKPVSKNGKIFLSDALNHRIQVLNLLDGKFLRTFGSYGKGPGQFNEPGGSAFDAQDRLFVADFHNNRIQVFDTTGKFLFQFGKPGSGDGELFRPIQLKFDRTGQRLYVVDNGNQRIQVFDRQGKFLMKFGGIAKAGDEGNGTFLWPFGITIGSKGDVFVTDPGQQIVEKFSAEGRFVSQWGGWGTEPGQFYKPKGIAADGKGRLYVVDFGNHRGQMFSEDGKSLGTFGEGVFYPAPTRVTGRQ